MRLYDLLFGNGQESASGGLDGVEDLPRSCRLTHGDALRNGGLRLNVGELQNIGSPRGPPPGPHVCQHVARRGLYGDQGGYPVRQSARLELPETKMQAQQQRSVPGGYDDGIGRFPSQLLPDLVGDRFGPVDEPRIPNVAGEES